MVEGTLLREGLFHFTVAAANADGQIGRRVVALTVTGSNQPPTDIGLDNASVPALQPVGSVVGRLATVDANPLDTHTYQLVTGIGDTNNMLFDIVGDLLLTFAIIDPSVTPICSIRVRSTDAAGLFWEKSLVLPVMGAPQIIEEPNNTRVFTGRPFALEVKASGREPLLFQWQEDGVDLPGEHGTVLQRTAGLPGARSYCVSISNAFGVVTSVIAVVTVDALSFGAWASLYAEPGGPSVLPEGDVNGDGIVNWYDYVFGVAPTQAVSTLPRLRMTPSGPAFVYRRARNVIPLTYDIYTNADLRLWGLFTPFPADVTIKPVDNLSEELEVQLPYQDLLFLKLEVTP
jgi:hypothetical protein